MDEAVSTFGAITGTTDDVARGFLQLTGGDFERAVALFYESPDLASGIGASASSSAPAAPRNPRPSRPIGREDASGVIHIDSDDDADMNMEYIDDDSDGEADSDRAAAEQAASLAQEEEDAAMAKRLQEELYAENNRPGGAGLGDDDVRAPIARTTETLVAPNPSWGAEDGLENAFLEQMRQRRPLPARTGGPFSQRIWGDAAAAAGGGEVAPESGTHVRRLEELFRPPYDLMARIPWDEARAIGKEDMKWIMVNLQDMNDFNCQALNRDIWKDKAVKDLVSENFLFLQYDKDFPDAEEYITFYFPNQSHENMENYPHVSIIDPRTGEQVKVWSGRPFPSAPEFLSDIAEFLDRYSLAANSKNPVAKATARKAQPVDVDRMTEDEMLEMALKNSLAGAPGGGESSRSGSTPNIHDPDALTKAATPEDETQEEPAVTSPFAQISSKNPHTEPENDPATTTRIQFRHPNGRVIRRFKLHDSVRTLFEWLKAEPLEGKEGIEFELKKMPQGQDLLGVMEETVEGVGLRQGTVMIEFLED